MEKTKVNVKEETKKDNVQGKLTYEENWYKKKWRLLIALIIETW